MTITLFTIRIELRIVVFFFAFLAGLEVFTYKESEIHKKEANHIHFQFFRYEMTIERRFGGHYFPHGG